MAQPIKSTRQVDATGRLAPRRVLVADRVFTGAEPGHLAGGRRRGAVAIEAGVIAWAGAADDLPAAHAAWPVHDHGAATILPGLVETHAHLGSYARAVTPDVPDPDVHTLAWEALSSVKIARQLASLGVTAVQSLGAASYADVALREAVQAGLVAGPRIVASGPPVTLTAGHDWVDGSEIDSIPDILHAVREHHKAGADVIKVMATGGFMSHSTAPWNAQFTLAELRALSDDAHRLGKRVAAHAHGTEGIRRAAEAGFDFIAHGSFVGPDGLTRFEPEVADLIAEKGIFVDHCAVPTFPAVPGEPAAARAYDLYRRGVKVVVGHDIGAVHPASAYTFGLRQLEAIGLPRGEVLIAATSRGAAAIGLAGTAGVLAPGYAADLIVAAGDPLADLRALDNLVEVVIGGETFDRERVPPFDPDRLAAEAEARRAAEGGAATPDDVRQARVQRALRASAHPLIRIAE
ncbi:MAG: amidohydrolase family protein [Bifidobacteriaceae bacterium]|jgi:imidazolonepropionase-like amidohydrolase|nr:amidohydrolase family protein [Bifidobacteriaceae bacterium]